MKKLTTILLLISMAVIFSGCETVKGVGRDIEKAGGVIEKAAS